jgi:hypothetical protein
MGYSVFISHASHDREFADALKAEIQRFDVTAYMFEYDAQPGAQLPAKLIAQIQNADALVVILSQNGLQSAAVNQEIGVARGAGKLVVPLVEHGVDPSPSTLLQGLEWMRFDRDDPETVKRAVADYLEHRRRAKVKDALIVAAIVAGLLLWANSST